MKKILLLSITSLAMLMADFTLEGDKLTPVSGAITTVTDTATTGEYTIVPGVYGYGTDTRAAYGGTVDPVILHVNTLTKGVSNTDSTHGSFEWAVTRSYPRVVVFDVSGVINCDDKILISDPYLTVAGETAPAPVVLDGSITIFTHDVLFTHFAVRPTHNIPDRDGFAITAYNGPNYNIVIDHCSASWATDENIQVWTSQTSNLGIHDVTFSNMLIAEGIYDHACGFINSARNIGMIGSILAHNNNRHPFLKVGSETLFWNNIIYNYTYRAAQLSGDYLYQNDPAKLDFRGNVAIAGPNSGSAINAPLVRIGSDYGDNFLQLYMKDNIRNGITYADFDVENPVGLTGYKWSSTPLKLPANAVSYDSSLTYDAVLSNAGARPVARDAVDTRIINEIKTRTGGGKITAPPAMPKYTEIHQAFVPVGNPHEMYDNYYTNLEHQLHQLAAALEP